MRAYTAASEEARRARDLLKDWRGEGLLTPEQYQRMEQETLCDLRCTNVFLRLVLLLFTVIITVAGVGLFYAVFLSHAGDQTTGVLLLMAAGVSYAAAEVAVSEARLYRYGIEEGLLVAAVAFLCVGLALAVRSNQLVWGAGAVASLWIWHRFGLSYAFVGAMVFTALLAEGHRLILAGLYAGGLVVRPRSSIAEALLWLGIYLAVNLKVLPMDRFGHGGVFYWATWVLIWCLPAVVLWRGIRLKDRLVMGVGAVVAILTLVTNKPYLGWERHTWDPMVLGGVLVGVSLFVKRWLAEGAGGVRAGFTAQRLSGKDKGWMSVGVTAVGLAAPDVVVSRPQERGADVQFGGGESGGGGATSSY